MIVRLLLPILSCGLVQAERSTQPTLGREFAVEQLMADAEAALNHGELEVARAGLARVLSKEEGNTRARLELVNVLIKMARWAAAEKQARILHDQFPTDTEPLFLMARIALGRGDPSSVAELVNRCIERGDNRPEIYKMLAITEYLLQRTDQFEAHIQYVLDKNPQDAEAQYLLSRYLYEMKLYGQALPAFQAVLDLQPEHYKAHYYEGLIKEANGDTNEAQAEFRAAIRIVESKSVHFAWPFADLGRQLADAGDLETAINWLSRGIHNDPTCPKVYYEYARALFQRGLTPQVEKALNEAVRLDPGYTDAYYLLARYYRKADNNVAADEALTRFRELKAHPVPSPYGLPRQ